MECSIEGCIKPVFRKGMCSHHYEQDLLARQPICSVEGCESHSHAKGLCNKHYRRELAKENPPCSVEGCGRPRQAHGYCNTHYQRKMRHGHLDPTRPADWGAKEKHPLHHSYRNLMKKKGLANIDQEWLDDFWAFVRDMGEKPDPRATLRRKSEGEPFNKENCYWRLPVVGSIKAKSKREYHRKYARRLREEKPEGFLKTDFNRRYGITLEGYDDMLAKQNGKCLICDQVEKVVSRTTGNAIRMAVDHCHDTGKVRGLLCQNCNTALGGFKDSIDLLKSAITYLEKHSK